MGQRKMKKAEHREHWDTCAAKVAMADSKLYADLRQIAWHVDTHLASSMLYINPKTREPVDHALKLLDKVDDDRCRRYLLRAMRRTTTRPEAKFMWPAYDFESYSKQMWRTIGLDWAKMEQRVLAEVMTKSRIIGFHGAPKPSGGK